MTFALARLLGLIPRIGIVGAASASPISYTLNAVLLLGTASRQSGVPVRHFLVPRRSDVGRVIASLRVAVAHAGTLMRAALARGRSPG